MDGMMAAEEIRKVDTEVIIIFYYKFAAVCHQGLCRRCAGLCAEAGQLLCVFDRDLAAPSERVARRARHFLQINAHGTAHKLDTSAIYWIENCGHDLVFHTAEGR